MGSTLCRDLTVASLLLGCLPGLGGSLVRAAEGSEKPASGVSMPVTLEQATRDIRAGRHGDAELAARNWLAQNKQHTAAPMAHYLLGQAMLGQGRHEEARVSHDEAVDSARDRTLKALAMLGRADSNHALKKYRKASRQYHWLEQFYRDVTAVPQEELYFKLGMCNRMLGNPNSADYWFNKVVELYAHGSYAEQARRMNTRLGPATSGESAFYTVELGSFADETAALKEAEVYSKKGYRNVHVTAVEGMLDTKYSIRVGKHFNKNDAKRAEEDAQLTGKSAFVKRERFANVQHAVGGR